MGYIEKLMKTIYKWVCTMKSVTVVLFTYINMKLAASIKCIKLLFWTQNDMLFIFDSLSTVHIVPIIADWCWVVSNEVDGFISSWSSSSVGKSRIDAEDDVAIELLSPRRIRRFSCLSSCTIFILNKSGTACLWNWRVWI